MSIFQWDMDILSHSRGWNTEACDFWQSEEYEKKMNLQQQESSLIHSTSMNSLYGPQESAGRVSFQRLKQRQIQPSPLPPQPIPEASRHAGAAFCCQEVCHLSWSTGNGTLGWWGRDSGAHLSRKGESIQEAGTVGYNPVGLLQVPLCCPGGHQSIAVMEVTSCFRQCPPQPFPSTAFPAFPAGSQQFIDHIPA